MDLGQVFTTKIISNYMASLLSNDKKRILEPCFGGGAFIEACLEAGFQNIVGCELDGDLYETAKRKYPELELIKGDFLKYEPTNLFDAIIMNPPYIRQEKIDDLVSFGITKKEIRKNYIYNGLPSTANMYMYFVIKAISLLNPGGELVIIFPGTWMDARSGKSFEKLIKQQASIIEKIYVSGDVFDENALVDVVILKMIKDLSKNICTIDKHLSLVEDELREQAVEVYQQELNFPAPFSKYANVRRGLSTGWNKMFINPEGIDDASVLVDIISSPKSIKGYATKGADFDKLLVIPDGKKLSGKLQQYLEANKQELLNEKKPKTLYEKCSVDSNWFRINELNSEGILFGYIIRNDMRFVLNDAGVVARDNFYIIKPRENIFVTLSLMNNFYTYYQLEKMGKKYGAGVLKIQRYDVENLMFIDLDYVSKEDFFKLETLGKKLVDTSDRNLIFEITKVISNYASMSYEKLMSEFGKIKKRRLEA